MYRWISILWKIVGVIILLLAVALSLNALSYLNFDPTYSFLRLKQRAIETGWYLPAFYSHVGVSACILVIGFFQLHPYYGRRWPKVHRALGYFYVLGILFFAAPGGLIMSLFIGRGPIVMTSFLMQGSLWLVFTALAFDRIKKRDIEAHRRWMWRSFALTFAAISLRIYIYIASYFFDLSNPLAYGLFAWMSWLPNLIIIEAYLRRGTSNTKLAQN
jgi:hypothetical protein